MPEKERNSLSENELESFSFDERMLSCVNKGRFPDLAIKLNSGDEQFTGGELIELKDSKKGYSVASFNSTIPTGEKDVKKLTEGQENTIRTQMEEAGNNILSLPIRQVFYLIRGRKRSNVKVCLTHGKFFETVSGFSLDFRIFWSSFRRTTGRTRRILVGVNEAEIA